MAEHPGADRGGRPDGAAGAPGARGAVHSAAGTRGSGGAPAGAAPRPVPRWAELVTVGVGGALGTLTRAAASHAWPAPAGGLPTTTLAVNLVGALLLGLLLGHLALAGPDAGARKVARLGVGTGFMGGLTTYSTFMVESERLLTGGRTALGLGYLLGSLLAGLLAAAAGLALAARLHGGERR